MILSVNNLSFSYDKKEILSEVTFDVNEGEFLSVLGPNGAGKSTLFKCILGIISKYKGIICINERNLTEYTGRELAGYIAYIPQIHRPVFGYTAMDIVLMGMVRQISVFSKPGKKHIEAARRAMNEVGIDNLRDRNISGLSGGEQQLVYIARAIAQNSKIIVMDEPTSALDYGNQLRVLRLVKNLTAKGYTLLVSTHNPQHALSFSDKILALYNGRVKSFGDTKKVF